ncbi:hypothetical protein QMP26_34965 [Enterocloster clostridioformis]
MGKSSLLFECAWQRWFLVVLSITLKPGNSKRILKINAIKTETEYASATFGKQAVVLQNGRFFWREYRVGHVDFLHGYTQNQRKRGILHERILEHDSICFCSHWRMAWVVFGRL